MASKLVMIAVFICDLIAFGLAIAAEQRRSSAKVISDAGANYTFCQYDSDIATTYGVIAFFFLLAGHVVVMATTQCFCCGKALNPGGSRACAVILFIICWLTFLIAEVCLFAGSVRNAYHTKYRNFYEQMPPSCSTLRKGVFAAGAAFTFFTAIISEFYYNSYSKARRSFSSYGGETGVGMGTYQNASGEDHF